METHNRYLRYFIFVIIIYLPSLCWLSIELYMEWGFSWVTPIIGSLSLLLGLETISRFHRKNTAWSRLKAYNKKLSFIIGLILCVAFFAMVYMFLQVNH